MILANVIFPTLMTHGVIWLVLLGPVIFLEARVLSRSMHWSYSDALKRSARANLISTIAGFPLAHVLGYLLGMIVFFYGHLLGAQFTAALEKFGMALMLSGYMKNDVTATGVLITLFFVPVYWYLSSIIEFWAIRRAVPQEERALLRLTSFRMNALSYAGLATVLALLALAIFLQ